MIRSIPEPPWTAATARVGEALRAAGYGPRRVAQALAIIAWNGPDLDGAWWRRSNCADGKLRDQVDLLIRGHAIDSSWAREAIAAEAWEAGIVEDSLGRARATGTVVPFEDDLVWTDRADRAFKPDGLFLPDSTTLAIRRCLPRDVVGRHLDIGCAGGAVTARAARSAGETVAVDINPRSGEACWRTAALSGITGIRPSVGTAADTRDLGHFDRVTFVLPLLVPWVGQEGPGPIHTIAAAPGLLREVVEMLPALLAPGGLALFYAQFWVGGEPLPDVLATAFGPRPWRGAGWWDYEDDTAVGRLRSGILAVRADRGKGWTESKCDAPNLGTEDWWPHLAALLS